MMLLPTTTDIFNIFYFCGLCIIMYHNNVTNLIHFSLSQSLYCVLILYMFRASIFRRHYTSSFWFSRNSAKNATLVPSEDGSLTPETCRGLRHNKVIVKVY